MQMALYYTIPSDNRELQQEYLFIDVSDDYTIPSDNRELQRGYNQMQATKIIPYQVITGNYNKVSSSAALYGIIPYQVITGNYNR